MPSLPISTQRCAHATCLRVENNVCLGQNEAPRQRFSVYSEPAHEYCDRARGKTSDNKVNIQVVQRLACTQGAKLRNHINKPVGNNIPT